MDHGVRKNRAHAYKHRGHPAVGKMTGVPGQRDSQKGEHGQHAGLRGNQKVSQCRLRKLALNHEHEASGACFDGFVSAQHQAELVFLVYELL